MSTAPSDDPPVKPKQKTHGPPQSFRDAIVDSFWNALDPDEQERLRQTAQDIADKERAAFKEAVNAPPSKDPAVLTTYVLSR